jgi:hypothetical protein
MADSSSSNKEQALVIVVPVGLPPELHQNKTHQLDGEVSIHVQYALLLATYVA